MIQCEVKKSFLGQIEIIPCPQVRTRHQAASHPTAICPKLSYPIIHKTSKYEVNYSNPIKSLSIHCTLQSVQEKQLICSVAGRCPLTRVHLATSRVRAPPLSPGGGDSSRGKWWLETVRRTAASHRTTMNTHQHLGWTWTPLNSHSCRFKTVKNINIKNIKKVSLHLILKNLMCVFPMNVQCSLRVHVHVDLSKCLK